MFARIPWKLHTLTLACARPLHLTSRSLGDHSHETQSVSGRLQADHSENKTGNIPYMRDYTMAVN